MFKKIKGLLGNKKTSNKVEKESDVTNSKQILLANYDRIINYTNYNKEVNDTDQMKNLEQSKAFNEKIDIQLEQLQKADAYLKNEKIEEGLSIYKKAILEDGLYVNSQGYVIGYLNHLYRLNRFDEAWAVVNELMIKYPSLEKKYREFMVKVLKKEKKFKGALYHQVLAILFDNIHNREQPIDTYQKKYIAILKKLKLEDKQDEVQELINKYTRSKRYDQRSIKNGLVEIIKDK